MKFLIEFNSTTELKELVESGILLALAKSASKTDIAAVAASQISQNKQEIQSTSTPPTPNTNTFSQPVQQNAPAAFYPQQIPTQQQPSMPQQIPVQQQMPINQPAAVPTTAQTYTIEQLAVAATQLVDAGRRAELVQLLASYNVPSLTALPKEQYGNFATALRQMGAKI